MTPLKITFVCALGSLLLSGMARAEAVSCHDLTSTCECLPIYGPRFEVNCNLSLNIKYVPRRSYVITYQPHAYSIGLLTDAEDGENRTEGADLPRLNPLDDYDFRVLPVEDLQVAFCDASASTAPIERMIKDARPAAITLRSMAFPGNALRLGNRSDPELRRVLRNVTFFALKDDELIEMPRELLADMPNLKELQIISNLIERIDGPFSASLEMFSITFNNVSRIAPDAFRGLRNVKSLELFRNKIATLDAAVFDDLAGLKSLELMGNLLRELDDRLFARLSAVKLINLSRNQLTELPEKLFWANRKLQSLRLEGNALTTLPESLFQRNARLAKLNLSANNLSSLPDGVFRGLDELQELDLSHNRLDRLSARWFESLKSLTALHLNNNGIGAVDSEVFSRCVSLKFLDLGWNNISGLPLTTFLHQEKSLRELRLAHNQISLPDTVDDSFVNYLEALEILDLSYNVIDYIPVDMLLSKLRLRVLNLSKNVFTIFDFLTFQNAISNVTIDLSDNNITHVTNIEAQMRREQLSYFDSHYLRTLILRGNPLRCDVSNYDLYRYFKLDLDPVFRQHYEIPSKDLLCDSPDYREGSLFYEESTINPCTLKYPISLCATGCDCYHAPHENRVVVDCAAKGLQSIPELFTPHDEDYHKTREYCYVNTGPVVEVILRGNRIRYLQPLSFVNINVTFLDVSFNNLSALTWIPDGVKTLKLDHNNLTRINNTLLENLPNVTLNNNPWICDCQTVPFWTFLTNHSLIPNTLEVRCADTKVSIRGLTLEDLCPVRPLIVIVVIVSALLIVIPAVVCMLYYKYKQEIKVWLYAHNMCLWFVREEDIDRDKIYDAFISHSHKDEDFVAEKLLERLEKGPDTYKCCVHNRDWIPGEAISKQVADSVFNSRRTIVVLSPAFLESVWGKMEFRAAHVKAISEGVARVIVIIYDDLDPDDERIDEELKLYLKTNTYIKWGDPWFWDKLKYALPHRKALNNHAYVNKRFESVSVNLDKMDKLNQNFSVNCNKGGVNPPIDPLLLKVHPLDINTPPAEKGVV